MVCSSFLTLAVMTAVVLSVHTTCTTAFVPLSKSSSTTHMRHITTSSSSTPAGSTLLFSATSTSTSTSTSTGTTVEGNKKPATSTASSSEQGQAPPLSPLTSWGQQINDIKELQQKVRSDGLPDFAPTISAKELGIAGDEDAQLTYFQDHAMEIKTKMQANAAVIFRDFDLMKHQEGFQQMYNAIGMKTCLDPLHSVSARPTVDGKKNSPVYEAVNKESRKNFFIGKQIPYHRTSTQYLVPST